MAAVCDTGPLIALAKINRLALLARLFAVVSLPPAVHHELLAKSGPETDRLEQALADFLQITSAPLFPPEIEVATVSLDKGEREAIALAHQQGNLLVIDDRAGRIAARRAGIAVTGTAGVLIQAKKQGLEPAVGPLLEELRRRGYWLSDELLETARRLAGEN